MIEAGLKIVQRNAQQLFDVVKATFSLASISTAKEHVRCEDLNSPGDNLFCRYNEAMGASSPSPKIKHLISVSFCHS